MSPPAWPLAKTRTSRTSASRCVLPEARPLSPASAMPVDLLILAYWGLTSTTWLVLWSVLATLTVLLVVLLRTRWASAKPWRKCAILSLWVHVLLGCMATTVRIVTGAPEIGNDQPIRVAVRTVVEETKQEPVEETAPEWEQAVDPPLVAPEPESLEAPPLDPPEELAPLPDPEPSEPAPPLEAPSLLEAPTPEPTPANEELSSDEPPAEPDQPAEPPVAPAAPTDGADAKTSNEQPARQSSEPLPSDPEPADTELPETYADRFAKDRDALVEQRGGSAQTERAVRAALGWLATAQSDNGGWDASRFGAGAARVVLSQDRRGAGAQGDTGVTGLALLAFLGAGHTHSAGAYTHEVAGGLEYLRQRQRSDGSLYGDAQFFARMYCHSMATFAVCEALALTKDERLEPMARAAVRYTLSMQHPTDGGWRYQRGDTGDTKPTRLAADDAQKRATRRPRHPACHLDARRSFPSTRASWRSRWSGRLSAQQRRQPLDDRRGALLSPVAGAALRPTG